MSFFIFGCFNPGGAGLIKGYKYQCTKDELEKAIIIVLNSSKNIYRDTTKNYIHEVINGKTDSINDNYYNDGKNYWTIKIKTGDQENEYIFRFYGDEECWKTSPTSEIFIVYAYDKNGKGGQEGSKDLDKELRDKLTTNFESEFIGRIDMQLHLTHTTQVN